MRPVGVVVDAPLFDEHFGFQQGTEEFPVEAFVAQFVVEAFDVTVFPRAAGPDVDRFDFVFLEPVAEGVGDELPPLQAAAQSVIVIRIPSIRNPPYPVG